MYKVWIKEIHNPDILLLYNFKKFQLIMHWETNLFQMLYTKLFEIKIKILFI